MRGLKVNDFMRGGNIHSFQKNVLVDWMISNDSESFATEPGSGNLIYIRGKRINLDDLVNTQLYDRNFVKALQKQMHSAKPYQHIVTQDWFNPTLLELIHEEFDLIEHGGWRKVYYAYQHSYRSQPNPILGAASTLYFNLVNSGWFLALLSQITKVSDLLPDPMLYGGGLHETRRGGGFGVHTDFTCHINNGLRNEMVFITYLNKNWDPSWAGALELWDSESKHCVRKVVPEFGRSILMRNGKTNFHGHPTPLNCPPEYARRSVASYYYTNPLAREMREQRVLNQYLSPELLIFPNESTPFTQTKQFMKMFVPPILWEAVKKITHREPR